MDDPQLKIFIAQKPKQLCNCAIKFWPAFMKSQRSDKISIQRSLSCRSEMITRSV